MFKGKQYKNLGSLESRTDRNTRLKKLNLSNFDTSRVTLMTNLFNGCSSLEELNLDFSLFITINVKNMKSMFRICFNLKKLNLSTFYTPKLIDIYEMFLISMSVLTSSTLTTKELMWLSNIIM